MSNIDALARDWLDAKSDEQKANARRLKIEKELTAALDAKDEGSITQKLDGYKVTLTQPVRRSVDAEMWESVKYKIPEEMRPVKTKLEADASGMKWLAENEPSFWAAVAPAFTTKPGKISVKVEAMEKA
jgi:hypothetical protein